MRIDIVTALPGIVEPPLEQSIIQRATAAGLVEIHVHDLRSFGLGAQRQIDDYPYGGGAGMVLKPEPICDCVDAIVNSVGKPDEVIFMTPDGRGLTQQVANVLSLRNHLVIIAGHYKGVDQRVRDTLVTMELSIGDYVLSGGELPALVLVDALVRLRPGVLGDSESALSDSHQDGLLGAPVYTRPAAYKGMDVPDVLLSGDHEKVRQWREKARERKTRARRPDMLLTLR